jgi:hypothetical protein
MSTEVQVLKSNICCKMKVWEVFNPFCTWLFIKYEYYGCFLCLAWFTAQTSCSFLAKLSYFKLFFGCLLYFAIFEQPEQAQSGPRPYVWYLFYISRKIKSKQNYLDGVNRVSSNNKFDRYGVHSNGYHFYVMTCF